MCHDYALRAALSFYSKSFAPSQSTLSRNLCHTSAPSWDHVEPDTGLQTSPLAQLPCSLADSARLALYLVSHVIQCIYIFSLWMIIGVHILSIRVVACFEEQGNKNLQLHPMLTLRHTLGQCSAVFIWLMVCFACRIVLLSLQKVSFELPFLLVKIEAQSDRGQPKID